MALRRREAFTTGIYNPDNLIANASRLLGRLPLVAIARQRYAITGQDMSRYGLHLWSGLDR